MQVKFTITPPVGWAANVIGVPWLWQGYSPQGFDCAGFLHWAWTEHWGVTLEDWQAEQSAGDDLSREKQARHLIDHFLGDCVQISQPVPGAGVLMRRGSLPNHVGLYDRGGDIIHACETAGSVIRERAEDLKGRIVGYYVPKQVCQK